MSLMVIYYTRDQTISVRQNTTFSSKLHPINLENDTNSVSKSGAFRPVLFMIFVNGLPRDKSHG